MLVSPVLDVDDGWEPSAADWAALHRMDSDLDGEIEDWGNASQVEVRGPETYELAPGPESALLFANTDPRQLDSAQLIDAMVGLGRLASWAQALQSGVIAELAGRRPPTRVHDGGIDGFGAVSRYVTDEVACALSLTGKAAGDQVELALRLANVLPATNDAWRRGELDASRVTVIADRTSTLTTDQARAVERDVLPELAGKTTGQVRRAIDRAVLAADPEAAAVRHARARLRRNVTVRPGDDGMADLSATLAVEEAALAHRVLTRVAETIPSDDARSLGQRRADALMGLLTGRVVIPPLDEGSVTGRANEPFGGGAGESTTNSDRESVTVARPLSELLGASRPLIEVVVAASTLAGLDQRPAEIPGYGPISAGLAQSLAAEGTWQRLLTDPVSGAVLDVGRTRYRPPAALVEHVRARDRVCTFPTCRQPAHRCQLDHAIPYDKGGRTSVDNLGPLCTRHHLLKTHTGWRMSRSPAGVVTWTSPTGHRYDNKPENYTDYTDPPASGEADSTVTGSRDDAADTDGCDAERLDTEVGEADPPRF